MKKILVTGAAGTVGLQVIRFLLSEGKYEITALELKTRTCYKRLKPFKKRINIVYGDVNDEQLVDALVKTHDVIIHCAGVLPPLANVREDLCRIVDYEGTVAIVDSIKNYNPSCFLLYASSASVYGFQKNNDLIDLKTEIGFDSFDFYSKYKLQAEDYIKSNLTNYSIFRMAYVLGDPSCESLIYNVSPRRELEVISAEDVGYAFVAAIDLEDKVNKKTFNVSGGEKFRILYSDYLCHILSTYGLTIRFLSTFLLAEKNYCGGFYGDGEKLEKLLHFRSKNIDVYYETLEKYKTYISRLIPRLLAIPFLWWYRKQVVKKSSHE